eukprot:1449974-Alexandrium_andersonii.AAC.1
MSASLVGSEMCIRDSARTTGARSVAIRRSGRPEDCAVHAVGAGPRQQRPVSYTHLTLPTICSV